jgi:hypothetical protein
VSAGEPVKAIRRRSGDRYDNLKRSQSFTDTALVEKSEPEHRAPSPIYSASTSNVAASQMVSLRGKRMVERARKRDGGGERARRRETNYGFTAAAPV